MASQDKFSSWPWICSVLQQSCALELAIVLCFLLVMGGQVVGLHKVAGFRCSDILACSLRPCHWKNVLSELSLAESFCFGWLRVAHTSVVAGPGDVQGADALGEDFPAEEDVRCPWLSSCVHVGSEFLTSMLQQALVTGSVLARLVKTFLPMWT